ncbi:MAG: SIMPL domain-containing protein [Candidatus Eremiobacteraeota bacterium]|nr:SIMPL domain-containing protein [Candidatus Eremiobacteraeota bacterium]
MKQSVVIAIAVAAIVLCGGGTFSAARAQDTTLATPIASLRSPSQISVTATGSVDYVPDKARVTLGIRADSPSAATAVDTINKNAAAVIAALKARGVPDNAIKTIGYNLFYREPPNPVPGVNAPAPVSVQSAAVSAAGTYQASELLAVTVPVATAGKVLDAAISAGANESFGLAYETSSYDTLYRQALAKAVSAARATADALAKAAHVSIIGIDSMSNSTEGPGPAGKMLAMPVSQASVLPGTDSVSASVLVVYRIK